MVGQHLVAWQAAQFQIFELLFKTGEKNDDNVPS
jgi:hypothetical protein